MENKEVVNNKERYKNIKANELVELEIKLIEKTNKVKKENIIRRTFFAAGILSLILLKDQISSEKINFLGTAIGGISSIGFFSLYLKKLKNKSKIENDLMFAKHDFNSEKGNLDLEESLQFEQKRKELGLSRNKIK